MDKQGQCGVYKLYKLGRNSGVFTTDFKTLERDVHVVTHKYAEDINFYSSINGLMYEYCEKESKLYWDGKPFKTVKEFTKFEEVKETTKEENILEDVVISELDSLKTLYFDLSGKKAHHLWKEEKIKEEIEKLKK
jgi:hypothetical protein